MVMLPVPKRILKPEPPMKYLRKQNAAFTVIELLVVIAVLAILAASLLPALATSRAVSLRIACNNNLKQVGMAFHAWAIANGGYMPMAVPRASGGDAEDVGQRNVALSQAASRGVSKMFLCLSNELSSPTILFCPAEYESWARNMSTGFMDSGTANPPPYQVPFTNDLNVSYFIGVDAQELSPRMLLAGDHNMGDNANPPTMAFQSAYGFNMRPFVSLGTNFPSDTTGPAYMGNQHFKQGNVLMADGSVECFDRSRLQDALKNSGDAGHPAGNFSLAVGSVGPGCNRIQLP
jgi:prepilin-type N-terminal cleavage/methylation domain-containing protein/prepilin-type processing-associated H-X9-DG protein